MKPGWILAFAAALLLVGWALHWQMTDKTDYPVIADMR